MNVSSYEPAHGGDEMAPELRSIFHTLNNQLGIVLAHAELLESKAGTEMERARAAQVVTSVLDVMGTTRLLRRSAARFQVHGLALMPDSSSRS